MTNKEITLEYSYCKVGTLCFSLYNQNDKEIARWDYNDYAKLEVLEDFGVAPGIYELCDQVWSKYYLNKVYIVR